MKVIHTHFGKDGGAERFFVNLVNALGERGVEQKFFIRPNRIWRNEIAHLGEIVENHYRRISLSQFWLEYKIRKVARDFQPDAIVSWMPRASRLMPKYEEAVKITRLGDFPKKLDHFSNCDVLVGNVPGIGERCRNLGWKKRVEIVSNFPREVKPVPVSRAKLDTPEDAFVVSSAGRFVHRKGMDALIRAVAKLDNAWLWLIGDGKEKANLEKIAKEVGMSDRLRFAGWQSEPYHFIASSDVFCMPSRHEPLGNVILEAWSVGLPVVSSSAEGPSWFMRHEENGLMIEIDDIDGYANAIQRFREDKKLADKCVKGGTQTLNEQFSKQAITDQYLNLFSGKEGIFPL